MKRAPSVHLVLVTFKGGKTFTLIINRNRKRAVSYFVVGGFQLKLIRAAAFLRSQGDLLVLHL